MTTQEVDKSRLLSQRYIKRKESPRNSYNVKTTVKGIYEVVTDGRQGSSLNYKTSSNRG